MALILLACVALPAMLFGMLGGHGVWVVLDLD